MSEAVSLRRLLACAFAASFLFLLPTSAEFTQQVRFTAAVGLFMALLWMSEAIPLGLTALIPLVAFPLSGIATTEQIAAPYANPAVYLFLGGFLLASTLERWNLHRRVAAFALTKVGTEPRRLVFAVILVTAFLSMWMSNTATTLMMTPIVVAIVRGLGSSSENGTSPVGEAALLGVAYAASLGGVGTPIGTPTNVIFLGTARELFPQATTVTFAQWMLFGVVYLAILVPLCWLLLIVVCKVGRGEPVPLEQLGLRRGDPMTRAEMTALGLCTATAILWITRADVTIGGTHIYGWASLFPHARSISDATVAVAMAALAFVLPVGGNQRLLGWDAFRKIPWDVLILFGGGFALAEALEISGFSRWAGANMAFLGGWPPVLMIVVLCIAVTLLSEMASNVATATAMLPIAAALATSIGVHPYMLMLPTVLAASSGFMLPVATAPNTIVYGTGLVRVRAMTRAGALLDLAAMIVITLLTFLVIPWATGIDLRVPLTVNR